MLIEEEAVPRRLLLVLHMMPENADVLNSLLLILLMLTAKPTKLTVQEAVPHSLLWVIHVVAEHESLLNRMLLILLMLTANPTKLILEEAVLHSLLLVLHGSYTVVQEAVLHSLLHIVVLNGLLLVPRSLLLVLQMFRANASSQEYSCKGRGF